MKPNLPYNPFKQGLELYDVNWQDVRLQVVGDKDNFVIYGRQKDGDLIVLNVVGNEVYSDDEN